MTHLGLIGGSGLYDLALEGAAWEEAETPWGRPSDAVLTGTLGGMAVSFLPRHGRGHRFSPSDVPYRANVAALKARGVTDLVSVSAVGSLREAMAPGHLVVPDQLIDRTVGRAPTFFEPGLVAHVTLARPLCPRLSALAADAAEAAGAMVHRGGTYLCMEGPQFSTRAESRVWRESWGADVIGMTAMPEARLAREAELCYATVALVTDYDSWADEREGVEVAAVLEVIARNVARARRLAEGLPPRLAGRPDPCPSGCDRALDGALLTATSARDAEVVGRLRAVAGRVL